MPPKMSQQSYLPKSSASEDNLVEDFCDAFDGDGLPGQRILHGDDKPVRSLTKRSYQVPPLGQVE